jgi:hypothetical protein
LLIDGPEPVDLPEPVSPSDCSDAMIASRSAVVIVPFSTRLVMYDRTLDWSTAESCARPIVPPAVRN